MMYDNVEMQYLWYTYNHIYIYGFVLRLELTSLVFSEKEHHRKQKPTTTNCFGQSFCHHKSDIIYKFHPRVKWFMEIVWRQDASYNIYIYIHTYIYVYIIIYIYIYRVITTVFILTTIAHWGSFPNLSWIYFSGPSFCGR